MFKHLCVCVYIYIYIGSTGFRSAQVRAYDNRASNTGIPYERAYALSSCALTYVAPKGPAPGGAVRTRQSEVRRELQCGGGKWETPGAKEQRSPPKP